MAKKVTEYAIMYRSGEGKWHIAAQFYTEDYDFKEEIKRDIYQAVDEFVDVAGGSLTDDTD